MAIDGSELLFDRESFIFGKHFPDTQVQVGWITLSDGERAQIGASLALGVYQIQGLPWKPLLVDGVEKLAVGARMAFLESLSKLDDADNIICCECRDPEQNSPVVPDGWDVWNFNEVVIE
jgi:hypothetical protein